MKKKNLNVVTILWRGNQKEIKEFKREQGDKMLVTYALFTVLFPFYCIYRTFKDVFIGEW
jgi:hypothetical protein